MGTVYSIATSNSFKVKNLNEFRNGLKDYIGGHHETPLTFTWEGGSKKSNNVSITINSTDFSECLYNELEEEINILKYIQEHLADSETATIHNVEYEHPSDMCIYKYIIRKDSIDNFTILEQ